MMGGQALSAGISVIGLIAVGRILAPVDYVSFSLLSASGQLLAVGAFEWLRIASARFEPSQGVEERVVLRGFGAQTFAFICIGVLAFCLAAGTVSGNFGYTVMLALALGACLQGGADLAITMLRSSGALNAFVVAQILRAAGGAIGAVTFAMSDYGGTATFLGFSIGSAAPMAALACYAAINRQVAAKLVFSTERLASYGAYGIPAAVGTALFFAIPVILRWGLSTEARGAELAGMLFAIDLLQKPFGVTIAALQNAILPGVIAAYEHRTRQLLPDLQRLYRMTSLAIVAVFLIGWGATYPVALFISDEAVAKSFASNAPLALAFFAFQAYLQNNVVIPSYLNKRTWQIALIALAECALLTALVSLSQSQSSAPLLIIAVVMGFAVTLLGTSYVRSALQRIRRDVQSSFPST